VVEQGDEAIHLAFGLRNFGTGLAILHGWYPVSDRLTSPAPHGKLENFRPQSRALYVPPGGLAFWQGALRDASDPVYDGFADAIKNQTPVTVELLYSDMNGGQRTVTRMVLFPGQDRWIASVSQHWLVDDHGQRSAPAPPPGLGIG
jgi:hypothetical protein